MSDWENIARGNVELEPDTKVMLDGLIDNLKNRVVQDQAELDTLHRRLCGLQGVAEAKEILLSQSRNIGVLIRKFQLMYPDIWAEVAVKTFKNVESYGDYRYAYLEWGWALALSRTDELGAAVQAEELDKVIATFKEHRSHNFPFFFVSKGIAEAAHQSDLKFTVKCGEMPLPFESFTLIPPKNGPMTCDGILIHRQGPNLRIITLGHGHELGEEIEVENEFDPSAQCQHSATLPWVLNVIFAMAAKPEYVESGHRISTQKKTRSEIWSPNIIGRKYATKNVVNGEPQTHRRLHWRRGHFRQQVYGVGRLLRRIKWIEPMMVGGKEK